jgi:hypothetical protein
MRSPGDTQVERNWKSCRIQMQTFFFAVNVSSITRNTKTCSGCRYRPDRLVSEMLCIHTCLCTTCRNGGLDDDFPSLALPLQCYAQLDPINALHITPLPYARPRSQGLRLSWVCPLEIAAPLLEGFCLYVDMHDPCTRHNAAAPLPRNFSPQTHVPAASMYVRSCSQLCNACECCSRGNHLRLAAVQPWGLVVQHIFLYPKSQS